MTNQLAGLRSQRFQGPSDFWAAVSVVVETDGRPGIVEIVDGYSDEFEKAAQRVVQHYQFLPGERNGRPVRTRTTLAVTVDK